MQDAANASTAFGRIRSFESILEGIDQAPGDVKPMAKKLPKKKKQNVGARGVSAAPCDAEGSGAKVAPESHAAKASIKKRPAPKNEYKSSKKSRLYSGAYYKAHAKAVKSGKGPEAAAKAARLTAQAACKKGAEGTSP